MRAVQMKAHGGYEELQVVDLPDPIAGAGDVLVKVGAAGVTPLDRTVLAGLLPTAAHPPLVLGNEGAGTVLEDPSGTFRRGERVVFFAGTGGVMRDGTYAELAIAPVGNLAPLPDEISDVVAAGLPAAYLSAFLALRQAGFRKGDVVLAPGVGGSVGNATLKLAGALGASRLLSTAGSQGKLDAARADAGLGAVEVIELDSENLAEGLKRLAPERRRCCHRRRRRCTDGPGRLRTRPRRAGDRNGLRRRRQDGGCDHRSGVEASNAFPGSLCSPQPMSSRPRLTARCSR